MKKKKILALVLAASMAGGMLAGCGSTSGGDETAKGDKSSGKVYYLNFKPEQADQWVELAKEYTDETGVQVDVQTAASGTYESQLKSEMAKDEAPTLFQVNGPVGLATWKDYCYDLSESDIYKDVESDDYVLKDGDAVDGIAYVIETYGLIYNKALLNKYFELPDASIKSIDELNNFQALKTAAEEIQAHKDDLGVEGAFTSAGMDSSSDWRFKTHLANLPIYYEYKADGIDTTDAIKGTYLDNYKQIWDLYLNNSTCEPSMISSKTGDDAASEFALGEAVFYQNGTWAYNDIKDNEVADEDMGMLPIYIGVDGEENQGLCTGSENYWCVNKNASEEDIQATLDFMNWCVTSEEGTKAMLPMTFGHECSGTIDKAGAKAEAYGYKEGDRVIINYAKYCHACDMCRSGHENLCTNVQFCMNGFAEYAVYSLNNTVFVHTELMIYLLRISERNESVRYSKLFKPA